MNRLLLKGMASIFMMATLFGNVSCSDSDEEPIAVAVTGVKVDKESVAIKPDAEVTLVATITPSDAANKEVSWTSSNTGVVLVDNTGKVKGVAEGEATVTVKTADGSFAASRVLLTGVQWPTIIRVFLSMCVLSSLVFHWNLTKS